MMNNMLMEAMLINDAARRGMLLNGKDGGGRAGAKRVSAARRGAMAGGAVRPPLFSTGALRFFRGGAASPLSA